MKRFVMIVTEDNGSICIDGDNTGFNAMEIVGFLETKKQDIMDQMNHPEKYKHVRNVTVDGEKVSIEEVKDDDQA